MEKIKPYGRKGSSKKEEVRMMFDNIAGTYDRLNHSFSLGIDKIWRRKAIRELKKSRPVRVMDVATGTGDFAIEIAGLPGVESIKGIDISEKMMVIGKKKAEEAGYGKIIDFLYGDAENIGFRSNSFDAVTVAFGVRNFENLEKGLKEMHRVIKPGGNVVILELAQPEGFLFPLLFRFYFEGIVPLLGRLISKDMKAYHYLPASVNAFPEGEIFLKVLKEAGFKDPVWKKLTLGTCSLYTAQK